MEETTENTADCGEGRNSIGGDGGSRSAEVSKQAADHPDARQDVHEAAIESGHVEKNSEIHGSELECEEVDVDSFEPSQQQARITQLSGEFSDVESTTIGLRLVGSAHHPRKARKAESEVIVPETPDTSQPEPARALDENENTISTEILLNQPLSSDDILPAARDSDQQMGKAVNVSTDNNDTSGDIPVATLDHSDLKNTPNEKVCTQEIHDEMIADVPKTKNFISDNSDRNSERTISIEKENNHQRKCFLRSK